MLKSASLTDLQKSIILNQATEAPFSGEYTETEIEGSYLCRNCGRALFRATGLWRAQGGRPYFDAQQRRATAAAGHLEGQRPLGRSDGRAGEETSG